MAQNIFFGVVENRSDPLELGRCQVRVVGLHTHDKNLLPTADLPWCATMQPTISAAMNGIGWTPIGPVEGSSVVVMYLDASSHQNVVYTCSMHPQIIRDKPGNCPICGMTLVKKLPTIILMKTIILIMSSSQRITL